MHDLPSVRFDPVQRVNNLSSFVNKLFDISKLDCVVDNASNEVCNHLLSIVKHCKQI